MGDKATRLEPSSFFRFETDELTLPTNLVAYPKGGSALRALLVYSAKHIDELLPWQYVCMS